MTLVPTSKGRKHGGDMVHEWYSTTNSMSDYQQCVYRREELILEELPSLVRNEQKYGDRRLCLEIQ